MNRIWIGDFRFKPLKTLYELSLEVTKAIESESSSESTEQDATNINSSTYIIEDYATHVWFATEANHKLISESPADTNIIIMPGLQDCINCCIWTDLSIVTVVENYAETIKKLVADYPISTFYVSAVTPVDGPYYDISAREGFISKDALNAKIEKFNTGLAQALTGVATFIDCYDYLKKSSIKTRDGIRYTMETSKLLEDFIISNIKGYPSTITSFTPRLEAPVVDSYDDTYDPVEDYWIHTSCGGENPFPLRGSGSTLPNCTAYAWGRFYEITRTRPTLSTGNAEQWYLYTSDGYERGQTPRLGAIICWQKGATTEVSGADGAGHVAVVEQINPDGSIVTSESGWNATNNWWKQTRYNSDGNWGAGTGYTFQGFIYCPSVSGNAVVNGVTADQLVEENRYLSEAEMQINARYVWQYLGSKGWTLNAVAGLLGNMESESGLTPNRYEVIEGASLGVDPTIEEIKQYFEKYKSLNNFWHTSKQCNGSCGLARHGRYPGCGLTGWTFAEDGYEDKTWDENKYIKWCNDRGLDFRKMDSGLERIIWECENGKQWIKTPSAGYDLSFKEFSQSNKSAYWLAGAFLRCYERPKNPNPVQRGKRGEKWYNYLLPFSPNMPESFTLSNFTIDKLDPTKVKVSFVVRNGKTSSYKLFDSKDNCLEKKELKIVDEKTVLKEDDDLTAVSNIVKIVSFAPKTSLTPNTKYKITVEAAAGDTEADKLEASLEFVTPQDYPEPVKKVELSTKAKVLSANSLFSLDIAKPKKLGYWGTTGGGYEIQLIVNNTVVDTLRTGATNINWNKFVLQEKFSNYVCKTGDNVQIGVRVWVTTNRGEILYDNKCAKVSKSICLLNKPINAYLNID